MLPILPALILLILQGPTNVERLVRDGRLPEALASISRQIESRPTSGSQSMQAAAKSVALASLLTLGNDPELASALVHMLALPEPVVESVPEVHSDEDVQAGIPLERGTGQCLLDGFAESQRSRDGPA